MINNNNLNRTNMKKFYLFLFAAATMLLTTTSCSQDEEIVQQSNDAMTTFKVELQGATGSRAAGLGECIDQLYYEVHHNGTILTDEVVSISGGTASLQIPLMRGEYYNIIFWAQNSNAGIYDATDLTDIKVTYDNNTKANKDTYDAFFNALVDFKATNEVTKVQLRRPFAQLNIGTIDTDWALAKTMITGEEAPVTTSEVTVKGLATNFNALEGEATGSADVTFYQDILLQDDATQDVEVFTVKTKDENGNEVTNDYYNLAMNYLLVPGQKDPQGEGEDTHKPATETEVIKTNADVTATFWRGTNNLFSLNIPNVTIQRNYRTNIFGTLLAQDKNFEIEVVVDFDDEDHNISLDNISTTTEFKAALDNLNSSAYNGPTDVVINLTGDIEWATGAGHGTTPFLTDNSKVKTLTIMGNEYTITATGSGVGAIRAANDGKLIFNDVNIVDESVSYAEGNWEFTYLEFAGLLEFNNCTFNSGIQLDSANGQAPECGAIFNDCKFHSPNDSEYSVWISQGTVAFNECEFTGTRGPKLHEAYSSEITSVTFEACTFDNLTKKPGIVIGDLNAETAVTIKNSLFINCQAGDQNKYIYESDTNVTSFSFTEENNTIFNDGASQDLIINNVATLKAFAASVNNGTSYAGKTVTLGADLDLANEPWTPIGDCNSGKYFQGTFDGNGKTIYNLDVDNSTDTDANSTSGLFGWIDAGKATIKNVTVDGATVKGSHWTGVIAGYMTGTVENCTVNNATVICNNVNEDANGDKAGGIVGYVNSNSIKLSGNTVTNSTITGNREVGGIAGTVAADLGEMKNNKVENVAITYITDKDYASAGIFASGRNNYIPDASNTSDNVTIAKLVDNADALKTAISNAADGAIIALADGTYEGLFIIQNKNLTIKAVNDKKAAFNGLVHLNGGNVTLQNLVFTNPNWIKTTLSGEMAKVNDYQNCIGVSNLPTFVMIEECQFNVTGKDGYGFYAYTATTSEFVNCTFDCDHNRPIATNGTSTTVTGCTFNNQYHWSLRLYENGGSNKYQKVTFTDNIVAGTWDSSKSEFEGINISRKSKNTTILADFVIKGNTNGLKFRYHKDITMSDECTYDTDIENFAFEKEN